jgi:amphi-Trp domain-containing protein
VANGGRAGLLRQGWWRVLPRSAVAPSGWLLRIGEGVSDVKVEQKQALSRQEAARFIAELAEGLADDGKVTVRLGSSTVELSVGDQLRFELEVAVEGDEIELELELKWSTSGRASAELSEDVSEQAEGVSEHTDVSEQQEGESAEVELAENESVPDASAEDEFEEGESEEDAVGTDEAESEQAVAPDQSAEPAPGRRSASAGAGKPAFNGVDTAAVRAWAAANGLTVSPRGRVKDEVLKAYRDAGN